MPNSLARCDEFLDRTRAVEQAVMAMAMQMNKWRRQDGSLLTMTKHTG